MPNGVGGSGAVGVVSAKTGYNREFGMITLVGTYARNLPPIQILSHNHGREAIDTPFVDPAVERRRLADTEIGDEEDCFIEVACFVGE
jgi:hypothetical protein